MKQHLTLYLPALLLGTEHWHEPAYCQDLDLSDMELMLSRARFMTHTVSGSDDPLFELFSHVGQPSAVAAVTHLVDIGPVSVACLRADPVCATPDRDRLLMLGNQHLNIRPEEVQQLVNEFNQFFVDDGMQLEAPVSNRWYLKLDEGADIVTTPLAKVIGQDIDPHLPTGKNALQWHSVLNEVQMLFYASTVNAARRSRGEPEINSLWFWGEGDLPAAQPGVWQQVWANDVLSQGLAYLSGIEQYSLPATGEEWLEQAIVEGKHLVVFDSLAEAASAGDLYQWREQLQGINEYWITPLLGALKQKRLSGISFVTESGRFEVNASTMRRWWKRRRHFSTFAIEKN